MTGLSESNRIIIFVKDAALGKVKTRLAAEAGEQSALILYQAMVTDLFRNLRHPALYPVVYLDSPDISSPKLRSIVSTLEVRIQKGSDLGERMDRAFQEEFERGAETLLLTGSDIPMFTSETVMYFHKLLLKHDAVIGPTTDGGYCCIGFHRNTFIPGVFYGIPWSTSGVLEATMKKFSQSGISVGMAPEMMDVDCLDDIQNLLLNTDLKAVAPKTAEAATNITAHSRPSHNR